jgi:hypothetical protein
MLNHTSPATPVTLGVILCKYCSCTIENVDTEKVVIYYSVCDQIVCQEKRNEKGEWNYEC